LQETQAFPAFSSATPCKWGYEDYSLQMENLPKAPPPAGQMELI